MTDDAELEQQLADLDATITAESGESGDHTMRAAAIQQRAYVLANLDRLDESVAGFAHLLDEFGDDDDAEIAATVARGLYNSAACQRGGGRKREALVVLDSFLTRYADAPPRGTIDIVVAAFSLKARTLWEIGRMDEAIAVFAVALDRYRYTRNRPARVDLAKMLAAEADLSYEAKRHELALSAADALIELFGESSSRELEQHVADARFTRALVLGELEQYEDQLSAWRELWQLYKDEPLRSRPTIGVVARYNEAWRLNKTGHRAEAAAICDELIERITAETAQQTMSSLAAPLGLRVALVDGTRSPAAVIQELDEILSRAGGCPDPEVRKQLALGSQRKFWCLIDLWRVDEAVALNEQLIAEFLDESESELERALAGVLRRNASNLIHQRRCLRMIRRPALRLTALVADVLDRSPLPVPPPRGRVAFAVTLRRVCIPEAFHTYDVLEEQLKGRDDPELQQELVAARVRRAMSRLALVQPGGIVDCVKTVELGAPGVAHYAELSDDLEQRLGRDSFSAAHAFMGALSETDPERKKRLWDEIVERYKGNESAPTRLFVTLMRLMGP